MAGLSSAGCCSNYGHEFDLGAAKCTPFFGVCACANDLVHFLFIKIEDEMRVKKGDEKKEGPVVLD